MIQKHLVRAVALCALIAGCSKAPEPKGDSMTLRQRDSAIGQSKIPGAKGITGALGAADSLNSKNAQLDSANAAP